MAIFDSSKDRNIDDLYIELAKYKEALNASIKEEKRIKNLLDLNKGYISKCDDIYEKALRAGNMKDVDFVLNKKQILIGKSIRLEKMLINCKEQIEKYMKLYEEALHNLNLRLTGSTFT